MRKNNSSQRLEWIKGMEVEWPTDVQEWQEGRSD